MLVAANPRDAPALLDPLLVFPNGPKNAGPLRRPQSRANPSSSHRRRHHNKLLGPNLSRNLRQSQLRRQCPLDNLLRSSRPYECV